MTFRWGVVSGLLLGCAVWAEPTNVPAPLSLDDCLRIGFERNATMTNARLDEKIAETSIRDVRSQVLPQLTIRGNATQVDEVATVELGGASFPTGTKNSYSAAAEVSQLLYSGGSVRAALNAAQAYRDLARDRTDQRRIELARDIKNGYYQLLLLEEAVRIREASVRQWEQFLKQTESRFQQGSASDYDRISAQVRLANERPLWTDATKNLDLAREGFRNLLHLDSDTFCLADEPLPSPALPELDPLLRAGRVNRPELRQLEQRLRLQSAQRRAEKGGYFPEIRLRGTYQGQNPPGFGSAENAWDWGWNAGLTAEWKLFDGAKRSAAMDAIRLEQMKTQTDLEEAERLVALQIRQAWLRLGHAREQVAGIEETLRLAQKSHTIARTRYESGLSTALEFADARLALDTAQFNRLQARLALRSAVAELEYASGVAESNWNQEIKRP